MRALRTLLGGTAAAAVAAAACSSPTATTAGDLVGRWVSDRADSSPRGSYQYHLAFTAGGGFAAEVRSYGVYSGQREGDLSAYSRTVGTYRVDADRLTFAPTSLTTWDRFYGADARPTVQSPYPYSAFYDDARFRVIGGVLRLDYTTYPADAAVPTSQTLRRER